MSGVTQRIGGLDTLRASERCNRVTLHMARILLIRHGQASAGTDNYDRLSDTGIRQAEHLATFWQLQAQSISAAYCGTLERQRHTAELALAGLTTMPELQIEPALNEYDHTVIDCVFGQGMKSDAGPGLTFNDYVGIMQRWRDGESSERASSANYQPWSEFADAGWGLVNRIASSAAKDDTIAFFTSGGVIATVLMNALNLDFEKTMHAIWHIKNASITEFRIVDSDVQLIQYNSVPHLLLTREPTLITEI